MQKKLEQLQNDELEEKETETEIRDEKETSENNTGKEGNDTLEESPVPETISDMISLESLKISETTATKKEEIIAIEIKTQTEEKENSEESGDDNKIIAKKSEEEA